MVDALLKRFLMAQAQNHRFLDRMYVRNLVESVIEDPCRSGTVQSFNSKSPRVLSEPSLNQLHNRQCSSSLPTVTQLLNETQVILTKLDSSWIQPTRQSDFKIGIIEPVH